MKRMKTYLATLLMATLTFTFTSCDEDWPGYHDDYGWNYYDYSQGWYDNWDWYGMPFDRTNADLKNMAQTLRGYWEGQLRYYYLDDYGQYAQADMDVQFQFDQYNASSLNGRGSEIDWVGQESQELRFSWYIDPRTYDIYIKYDNSGKTYRLDADGNSDFSGFNLDQNSFSGVMEGYNNKEYLVFDCTRTTLAKDNTTWETESLTRSVKSPRIKGERHMKFVKR